MMKLLPNRTSFLLEFLVYCALVFFHVNGQCPALTVPSNGSLYYHNLAREPYQQGDQATYVCDAGFGVHGTDGTGTRTCDGTEWSGSAIDCSVIRCPPLADYPNSVVVYVPDITSPYDFGTIAINLCLDGYYLIGSIFQYCGGHGSSSIGTWDGIPGSCARVECTSLVPPLNGYVVHSDPSPHEFNSTATYSCNFGTHRLSFSGSSGAVRTCTGRGPVGIWNGTAPTCEALTCNALPNPPNGRWRYDPSGSPYYVATIATLSCDMGYLVTGNGENNCTSDSVGLTAVWNGSTTDSCRAIMCSAIPDLLNGMISYSRTISSGMYSYLTTASHTCSEEFYITGSTTRTCGANEVEAWDGTPVTCIPITCGILPALMDGSISYAPDTTAPFNYMTIATYNCDTTFGLTGGVRMRTCVGSSLGPGEWDGTAPICIPLTCRELSVPANGNITYSSTPHVYGTEATHVCRCGFGINGGMRIRTCGGDGSSSIGTWSGNSPACDTVQCDPIPPLVNGGTAYEPDSVPPYDFETIVTQLCNEGFYRDGVRSRQCLIHDGLTTVAQWNGEDTQCLPIMCTNVPVPTNGVVTYGPDTTAPYSYHTVATHSCVPGFGPDGGDVQRLCTRSGTPDGFNGTAPECVDVVCLRLPPILNGVLSYSTTPNADSRYEYRTIGTYACNEGFYIEGSEMRTCDSDGTNRFGFWTGSQPACIVIVCPELFAPDNGAISFSADSRGYQSTATYSCNTGFGLSGNRQRTCVGSSSGPGVWTGTAPTCIVLTCSGLMSPANSRLTYSSSISSSMYDFGTVATFECDTGFALVGDPTRTCGGDDTVTSGVWSNSDPVCSAIFCPSLGSLANALLTYSESSPYSHGSIVSYECITGYFLIGNSQRTCGGTLSVIGVWSGSDPECRATTCFSLGTLGDGTISYNPDATAPHNFQTTATYRCTTTDYGLSVSGDRVRTCITSSSGGMWTGTAPTCEVIECAPLPLLANGNLMYNIPQPYMGPEYVINTNVRHICALGYYLDGNEFRTCTGNALSEVGSWTGSQPACIAVVCSGLIAPTNGFIAYATDTTDPYDYGTTATYGCDNGYALSTIGNRVRTCEGMVQGGIWSGSAPTCQPITCSSLPSVSDGVITYGPDQTVRFDFGTRAQYACNTGFYLSGNLVRSCGGDGTSTSGVWTGADPLCRPINCLSLPRPVDGTVTFSSTAPHSYLSTATFGCNAGFALIGHRTRTCAASIDGPGVWTGSQPSCEEVTCPSIPAPSNGRVFFSPDTSTPFDYGTMATYTCNTGFGISGGNQMRTCAGDDTSITGTWTGSIPACNPIVCSSLPFITNGVISYTPDSTSPYDFGTTAVYDCNVGFYLESGSASRACGGTGGSTVGTWDGTSPVCTDVTCPRLMAPTNGMITYAADTIAPFDFRTTATYSCSFGFRLAMGDAVRTCVSSSLGPGVWNGTAPVCEALTCSLLSVPTNGAITYSTAPTPPFALGTTATYSCDSGYGYPSAPSSTTVTCQSDASSLNGEWVGTQLTCSLIQCSSADLPISNGQLVFAPDITSPHSFGTAVTYSCLTGFYLVGNQMRTCVADGSVMNGPTAVGVWDGSSPNCESVTCLSLPALSNGQIAYATDMTVPFDFQTTATYSCSSGYGLSGGDRVRTCVGSSAGPGEWNGTAPSCIVTVCDSLPSISGGQITYASDTSAPYNFGTVATYSCNAGLGLDGGTRTRTCGDGDRLTNAGVWSGSAPTCGLVICPSLPVFENGVILIMFPPLSGSSSAVVGSIAQYECNTGYHLDGFANRNCVSDGLSIVGTWDGSVPTCLPITCPIIPIISGGGTTIDSTSSSSPWPFGTTFTYHCFVEAGLGLSANGDRVRTCVAGSSEVGVWNGTAPTCERMMCMALSLPTNGGLVYASDTTAPYDYGTTATISCSSGYGLSGNSTRTCSGDGLNTSGMWEGSAGTCVAVMCSSLPVINNGVISYSSGVRSSYAFGTTATYTCTTGFFLEGNSERTCRGDMPIGKWNGTNPVCSAISCPTLTAPANGFISYSDSSTSPGFLTTATYGCDTGYGLSGGDSVRTCEAAGTGTGGAWSGTDPACEGIMCPALPALSNGMIMHTTDSTAPHIYNTVADFVCDSGFGLTFRGSRTCTGDSSSTTGTWTGTNPECRAITCGPLPGINNGRLTYSPDTTNPFDIGTTVTYTCNDGFYNAMSGTSTRSCTGDRFSSTGSWDGEEPSCSAIECPRLTAPTNGFVDYTPSTDTFPYDYLTRATFRCSFGFRLMGDTERICSGPGPGVWTGSNPTCEALMCPQLSNPSNGRIVYSTSEADYPPYELGATATYECNAGYGFTPGVVNRVRTCESDAMSLNGEWSGQTLSCSAILCPALPSLGNGAISYGTTAPYGFNTEATHTCTNGYDLVGDRVRTCIGDGSGTTVGVWNNSPPTCVLVTCSALPMPENGLISYSPDTNAPYDFQTTATYSCASGYGLSGGTGTPTVCMDADVGSEEWVGDRYTCQPILCVPLAAPANGGVQYSTTGSPNFDFGTIGTYVCDTGFGIDGQRTRTCQGDGSGVSGSWSGAMATCNVIVCSALSPLTNGAIMYSPDTTSPYNHATTATHTCNVGFYLEGSETRMCEGDGSLTTTGHWSSTAPACSAVTCPSLTPPTNGFINYAADMTAPFDFRTTATYGCNTGYGLPGSNSSVVRTCVSSSTGPGEWDGTAGVCEPVQCTALSPLVNGQLTYSPDTTALFDHGTVATHVCDTRYGLTGSAQRTCGRLALSSTGVWSGSITTCEVIQCPRLPVIPFASIHFTAPTGIVGATPFDYGAMTRYECNTGYYLVGNEFRNCGGDGSGTEGVWDGSEPSCRVIECLALIPPSNGQITFSPDATPPHAFQTTATYSCSSGYGLSGGDRERTCASSSSGPDWTGTAPVCQVLMCNALAAPDNGRIVYSPDMTSPYNFGTTATYICESGFGLSGGSRSRSCGGDDSDSDGSWSGSAPICTPIMCTSLPSITNGGIRYSPDTTDPFSFGTVASYFCSSGFYRLGGMEIRTCGGDGLNTIGVWNGMSPTCEEITCDALSVPSNGAITYSPDLSAPFEFQTSATYTCDTGFGLSDGDRLRRCVGSSLGPGEWSGITPRCRVLTCPALMLPANGRIVFTSDSTAPHDFGTVATYVCDTGFGLVGNSDRTCGGTIGTWSAEAPTCSPITCPSLPSINNGAISYSSDTASSFSFNTVATFTCDSGFFLEGDTNRTCSGGGSSISGSWTGANPVCSAIQCPSLDAPLNGVVEFTEASSGLVSFQTVATYRCNTGFGLAGGDRQRTCEEGADGGAWTGMQPMCEEITCSSLPSVTNGQISYSPDTTSPFDHGTVATYSCSSGMGLVGPRTRTCGGDGLSTTGVWNDSAPTCALITCPVLSGIANGGISYSPVGILIAGTEATYSCSQGYYLQGMSTRACTGDGLSISGTWTGTEPTCIDITCSSLATPANGIIAYSPDTTSPFDHLTTATYICDSGFGLSGGVRVSTCEGSSSGPGFWNGTAPTCETVTCADLADIDNGYVAYSGTSPHQAGDVATYTCDTGYVPSHTTSRVCGNNGLTTVGVWSGTVASCDIIQCPRLPVIPFASIHFTAPTGIGATPFDYGAVVRYECSAGYYLNGSEIRNCGGDGSSTVGVWDGTEPTCTPIECRALTPPSNGIITFDPDATAPHSFTTTATYSCSSGYGLSGGDRRTCASSSSGPGEWTGTAPACQIITCSSLPSITNGMVAYATDMTGPFDSGTIATYTCDPGFRLDGSGTLTCGGTGLTTSGVWNGRVPMCVAVFCSALIGPTNGLIVYSPDTTAPFDYLTMATYQCDSGYGLGSAPFGFTRTCNTVGEWSGEAVMCDRVMCTDLSAPDNGRVTYSPDMVSPYDFGTEAVYDCDAGFGLSSGTRMRTCIDGDGLSNAGVWSGSVATCDAITCSALGSLSNGGITYSTSGTTSFSFDTRATFNCNYGYYLDGSSSRTCTGSGLGTTGSWTNSMPECIEVICSSLSNPTNGVVTYSTDPSSLGIMATATYSCSSGYGLFGGHRVRTCESSLSGPGVWSGIPPLCEPITCPALTNPTNGLISYAADITSPFDFGTVATYECSTGFGLVGGVSRMCEGDGSSISGVWSGSAASCQAISCTSLLAITNGTIVYAPDTTEPFAFNTRATYSCDSGFFFDGNEERTCGGDGSSPSGVWSGANPICSAIVCPGLDSPANGQIEFTETSSDAFNFQTMATYSCSSGYGLSGGDRVRTCVGSRDGPGVWSGTEPTCEEIICSPIPSISNGAITYSTTSPYSFSTVATHRCDPGYGITGSVTRTCGGDGLTTTGMWSGVPASCNTIVCPALSSINNGLLTLTGDTGGLSVVGTEASYSCNLGYYLRGDTTRTCTGDGLSINGTWTGMEPNCIAITCRTGLSVSRGVVTIHSSTSSSPYPFGSVAVYRCFAETGFGLSANGDRVRTCVGDSSERGVWNGTAPTCETIICSNLTSVLNGDITYSGTSPHETGDTATYTCDSGFGLVGGSSRTCGGDGSTANGVWSGSAPTCQNVTCPALTAISDGSISYSPDMTAPFDFGTTATYTCDVGFYLDSSGMRRCDGDSSSPSGMWDGTEPTCMATTCTVLTAPANGMITYTVDTTAPFDFQTNATYSCVSGFRLSGGNSVRTCVASSQGTGEWSGEAPICEALTCPVLDSPENGQISYSRITPPAFELGVTATYICNTGYGLSGTQVVRTCQNDALSLNGEWSGQALICIAITCSALSSISNGAISYTPDTMAPFDYNTDAIHSCGVGYYLQGGTVRSCGGDGTSPVGVWSGIEPACIEITCPSLSAPTNGFITYSPDTSAPFDFRTTATYGCNPGFGLFEGDTVSTCGGSTGQWSGTPPTCQPILCNALSAPTNGRIVYSNDIPPAPYDFGAQATYICDSGFGLNGGDTTRTCSGGGASTNGTWSGRAPTCEVIVCGSLPAIDNGMIGYSPDMISPYDFSTTATYSCNVGLYLDGSNTETCNGDGSTVNGFWDGTVAPVCSEIVCDSLTAPTNGFITFATDTIAPFDFRTTATHGCDPGYGLFGGDRVRTCVGSAAGPGEWSGTAPTCEVITCSSLSSPDNGGVSYSTSAPYGFGTMATYPCNPGFGSSDVTPRVCGGDDSSPMGEWSGIEPNCTTIFCSPLSPINNGNLTYSDSPPYEYNTRATYSCTEGFFLEGEPSRNCTGKGLSINGFWDQGAPVCSVISCPRLDSPDNGFITFTEASNITQFRTSNITQFRTTATYGCNSGYGVASGDVTRTCQESTTPGIGEWTGTEVICAVIMCPELPDPTNGLVTYSTDMTSPYNFGTVATYVCDTGFGLVDGATRMCVGNSSMTTGSWTASAPTCEDILCAALTPDANGLIRYSPDTIEPFDFRTSAIHSCNEGFFLEGNDTRLCDGDGGSTSGVWTRSMPVCSAIKCSSLVAPANGMVIYSPDTTSPFDYQTTASYVCDSGYGLSGGDRVRTCVGSAEGPGEWSGTAPTCEALMCSSISAPDNGQVTFSTDMTSPYEFGTRATYRCDSGFGISGGNVLRTCGGNGLTPNGTWTGTAPQCNEVTCASLNFTENGSIAYSPDTVGSFDFDTVATHSCNEGFYLEGIGIRTCVGDGSSTIGQWSGISPDCPVIECSELAPPNNGFVVFATDTTAPFAYQTMATYSCIRGYGLSGRDTVRTCVGSTEGPGEWSGEAPSCERIMCSALVSPMNGDLSFSPDMIPPYEFTTEASYTCDTGFDVAMGNETRVCEGDGSTTVGVWNGTAPICTDVLCSSLTPPVNGRISYFDDTTDPFVYGTVASYNCNPGFGIFGGDINRVCVDNNNVGIGIWSLNPPSCEPIVCGNLTAPANGRVVFSVGSTSPYAFGTVATYICDTGFGIASGNRMRICGGSGSTTRGIWNGDRVTCEPITCGSLTVINDGLISYSADVTPPFDFATNATHDCNVGFYLDGPTNRTCTGDGLTITGSWTASAPSCPSITCPALQNPVNGFITFSESEASIYQFRTTATYGCIAGYGLSGGDRVRTCVGSRDGPGEWSGTAPTCEKLMCADLPIVINGQVTYSIDTIPLYDFGTVATYICNTGFGISSGNRIRNCEGLGLTTNGTWNGVAATCDPITCDTLDTINNGLVVYTPDNVPPFDFNTNATHSCNEGFFLNGLEYRTCIGDGLTTNGLWTGSPPVCANISCPILQNPANGFIQFTEGSNSFMTNATYGCDPGYGLFGGDRVRTCIASTTGPGEWSGTAPTCQELLCFELPDPTNGMVVYSTNMTSLYDFGTVATYVCDTGFGISGGTRIRTCGGLDSDTEGIWNGIAVTCDSITCDSLSVIINGIIDYNLDTIPPFDFATNATYTCNTGYFLSGGQYRTCIGDGLVTSGSWTGSAPVCLSITCPSLSSPMNGFIEFSEGSTTSSVFQFMTNVTYSCNTGYGLFGGDRVRTCVGLLAGPGVWNGTAPSCEELMCADLPSVTNGTIVYTTDSTSPYDFGTVATYVCDSGFGLIGMESRQCDGDDSDPDGEWTGLAAECDVIICPVLSQVEDGAIDYNSGGGGVIDITFGTVATHSCNEGFYLSGGDMRVCSNNGTSIYGIWNMNAPICVEVTCPTLPDPVNGDIQYTIGSTDPFDYRTTATCVCNPGYGLSGGDRVRTCISSPSGPGIWNGTAPTCEALTCTALPTPDNGRVVFSSRVISVYDFGAVATYICDPGFGIISGTILRTCGGDGLTSNGTWTGTVVLCGELSCSSLDNLANGTIVYSPDSVAPYDFSTVATHSCNPGYFLEGSELRTCIGDGLSVAGYWDGFVPICREITCSVLPNPINGYIEYISDTTFPFSYLTTASYRCNPGFGRLGGNRFRTCIGSTQGPGVWNGTAPRCRDYRCPNLPLPANGQITFSFVQVSAVEFDRAATYSCFSGFEISGGNVTRICRGEESNPDGNWTGIAPTCEPITCSNLTDPTNGFVSYSPNATAPFGYLSTATYTCYTGYGLLGGDITRNCIASSMGGGEWNGTAPFCEDHMCASPPSLTNGLIIFSIDTTSPYEFGTVATYVCNIGYSLVGVTNRTCDGDGSSPNGMWTGSDPGCFAITCSLIPPLTGGSTVYSQNTSEPFSFGTTVTHTCNEGFYLTGNGTRTCNGDGSTTQGSWSGSPASCPAIVCDEELVAPMNGFTTFSSGTTPPFAYLTYVTYDCEAGFRLISGDRVRTCVGSAAGPGEWSGTAPTCQAITCNTLEISNGTVAYSADSTILPFGYGTTATYTCNSGSYLIGNRIRTCGGVGYTLMAYLWNGTDPTCVEITCSAAPVVSNGSIAYSVLTSQAVSFTYGTVVTYTCNTGYMFKSGANSRTCVDSTEGPGVWSGTAPTCEAIYCSDLIAPTNGYIEFTTDKTPPFDYLTTATYSCEDGLGLANGDPIRVCGGNYSTNWTGIAPVCEPIFCQSLNITVDCAKITYSTEKSLLFKLGTRATYEFDPSYKITVSGVTLTGSSYVRVCEGNYSSSIGSWSGYTPMCTGVQYNPRDWLIPVYVLIVLILIILITCICCTAFFTIWYKRKKKSKKELSPTPPPPLKKKPPLIKPSLEFVNPVHANEFSLSFEPDTKPPIVDDGFEFQSESIDFA